MGNRFLLWPSENLTFIENNMVLTSTFSTVNSVSKEIPISPCMHFLPVSAGTMTIYKKGYLLYLSFSPPLFLPFRFIQFLESELHEREREPLFWSSSKTHDFPTKSPPQAILHPHFIYQANFPTALLASSSYQLIFASAALLSSLDY